MRGGREAERQREGTRRTRRRMFIMGTGVCSVVWEGGGGKNHADPMCGAPVLRAGER